MNRHEEKRSLLSDLIALSKVDNNVSFMEEHFIYSVAQQLNISSEELKHIHENPVPFNPQDIEMERITQFYRLLLLMKMDGEYHEKEIEFCKNMGLKMGLPPAATNEVMKRIIASEQGYLPPEEVIKIFQTHHN